LQPIAFHLTLQRLRLQVREYGQPLFCAADLAALQALFCKWL
jgi:hypothetical protein